MLDIGWSELLVIAVVLIVVVGPKDLPPMLRAFGKMTANLRKMAGEFRSQFDEALRESDFDDVRNTIADAQKLNPTNSLREAINPLRQMGQDIRSDLQKATQLQSPTETRTDIEAQHAVEGAEPSLASALPEVPAGAIQDPAPAKAVQSPQASAVETAAVPRQAKRTSSKVAAGAEPVGAAPTKIRAKKPLSDPPQVAEDESAKAAPRRRVKKTETPKDSA